MRIILRIGDDCWTARAGSDALFTCCNWNKSLSGCDLSSDKSVNTMLRRISFFNDDVQALLFDPNKMAPTYPESMITRPFPFNASPTRALGNPRADPRQHIKFILFNAHLGELFRYRISG
jgi:hypothetical protein